MPTQNITLVAMPSGFGSPHQTAEGGPSGLAELFNIRWLNRHGITFHWANATTPSAFFSREYAYEPPISPEDLGGYAVRNLAAVNEAVVNAANTLLTHRKQGEQTMLIGGDHTQIIPTTLAATLTRLDTLPTIPDEDKAIYRTLGLLDEATDKPVNALPETLFSTLLGYDQQDSLPGATTDAAVRNKRAETMEYRYAENMLVQPSVDAIERYIGPEATDTTSAQQERVDTLQLEALVAAAGKIRYPQQGIGIIQLDAHADFNTPTTTPSGNLHGMTLATLAGLCNPGLKAGLVDPKNMVLIGTQSLEMAEMTLLKALGVKIFSAGYVKKFGMRQTMQEAEHYLKERGIEPEATILSFDFDGVDPQHAGTATGTVVPGGLPRQDTLNAVRGAVQKYLAVDFTEYHPTVQPEGKSHNFAVETVLALAGATMRQSQKQR